jgi:hypothetical protein
LSAVTRTASICFVGFGTDRLRPEEAMKTAGSVPAPLLAFRRRTFSRDGSDRPAEQPEEPCGQRIDRDHFRLDYAARLGFAVGFAQACTEMHRAAERILLTRIGAKSIVAPD